MTALSLLTLLVPLHGALADEWSRMNSAQAGSATVPAAVSSIWAAALADDRAKVARDTGRTDRYLPPNIGWTRIQTPRGPVIVTTLEPKCEGPNTGTATAAVVCSYVIASETNAFAPTTASACYVERDDAQKIGTDVRYDRAKNALDLRLTGEGVVGAQCARSIPLPK